MDRDGLGLAAADGLQHLRAAEGRHVTPSLQLEAGKIDAARGIDREQEMEVDRDLGVRRPADAESKQHDGAAATAPIGSPLTTQAH